MLNTKTCFVNQNTPDFQTILVNYIIQVYNSDDCYKLRVSVDQNWLKNVEHIIKLRILLRSIR